MQASDVLASVQEVLPKIAERASRYTGYFQAEYATIMLVAEQAGLETPDWSTGRGSREWDRFSGQVGRAMNKLASDGVIVKVSRGETGPEGYMVKSVRYYMPGRYAEIKAKADAERADKRTEQDRMNTVSRRLERALGRTIETRQSRPLLTVEELSLFADLLEASDD